MATRLVALDSWREESHRQLMTALARTGQFSAALSQYKTCRRLMLDVFGAEPSEETTALYERIRSALREPRHNLPASLTGFVGREEEIARIRRRMATPSCRLITIVGTGGSGKTRLALEAAASLANAFLNGVCFVALAAIQSGQPDTLATTLAVALHVSPGPGDLRGQLIGHLRSREMLLVLDNLEHLLDDAVWLSDLLTEAPDVKVLVTSRARLNLQAEEVIELGSLSVPPADSDTPQTFAAVELLLRRGQSVHDGFELTPANTPAAIQICRLVGGLPLGIELAAAWVNRLSCQEIATAIEANLDFLSTDRRDTSPRQRSLRAAFEHSWNLLSVDEQGAFVRLAVFRGAFSRSTAAAVADVPFPLLVSLTDKSLVRQLETGRYDLHEVLRQFADERQQADAALAHALRSRHGRFYIELLAAQTERLKAAEQREALVDIEAEIDDVRAAWSHAVAEAQLDLVDAGLEALYHFYMIRSFLTEGLELFQTTRLALEQIGPPASPSLGLTLVRLQTREAKLLLTLSHFQEAKLLLLDALERLRTIDAPADVANARFYLGSVYNSLGAVAKAEEELLASLAMRRSLNDRWGQAVSLLELCGLYFYRGDYATAMEQCQVGLHLAREVGDLQTIAHFLTGLSLVHRELGDYNQAKQYAEEGRAVYEALKSPYGRIQSLLTLGGLALAQEQYDEAVSAFTAALDASQAIGFRTGEADSHGRLGQTALAMGDDERAVDHLRQGLALAIAAEEAPLINDLLYSVATLAAKRRSTTAAGLIRWCLDQAEGDPQRRKTLVVYLESAEVGHVHAVSPATTNAAIELALDQLELSVTGRRLGMESLRDTLL